VGRWQSYFQLWKIATLQALGGEQFDLVPEFARYVPPVAISTRAPASLLPLAAGQSPGRETGWHRRRLRGADRRLRAVDGAECGQSRLPVVIVEDALSSSSDAGRDAPMTMYRLRFTEQINLVTPAQLPDLWRPE